MSKMNSIDLEISEKVAEEASKQLSTLKKEIYENKNVHISLLEDILQDAKGERKFLKIISTLLFILLFMVTAGSFALSIYNQKLLKESSAENSQKIFDFINNANFNSSVEMTTGNNSNTKNIDIKN